jgi:phenylacetate-CoA ligase
MHDPEVEMLPWERQAHVDDPLYRDQIVRLLASSRFYGDKLAAAGFASAQAVGGLDAIERLPFTEKDELRATPTPSAHISPCR